VRPATREDGAMRWAVVDVDPALSLLPSATVVQDLLLTAEAVYSGGNGGKVGEDKTTGTGRAHAGKREESGEPV
jgi:hypothetical protein